MKLSIRKAVPQDGDLLSPNLRKEDIQEYIAANGRWSSDALADDIGQSTSAMVIVENTTNTPIALVGCDSWNISGLEVGGIWLMASPQLQQYKFPFHRNCKAHINLLHEKWPVLANYTYANNTQHHKWLRSCGFIICPEPIKWGARDEDFYFFFRLPT